MKRQYAIIRGMTGLFLIIISLAFAAAVQAGTVRIGIVYDGESSQFEKTRDLFIDEIQSMTRSVRKVEFPADAQMSGGWNVKKINKALDRLAASGSVDMILAMGEVSAHEACRRSSFGKPVFAMPVVDAELQEIPYKKGTSGIRNLNYVNTHFNMERELKLFRRITPFSRIIIVVDEFIYDSIPQLEPLTRRMAEAFSLEIAVAKAKKSAKEVLAQIPPETEAVFMAPVPRFSDDEYKALADSLIARKLPGFSFRGRNGVQMGILTETIAEDNLLHLARNIAVNIREVLGGADAGSLPATFNAGEKLTVNMATARAIRIYPNWDLLTEANLINDEPADTERRMNIHIAMQEALKTNLNLAAADRSVAAGAVRVKEARSPLLPQLTVSSRAVMVDDDRAAAYNGTLPERQWTGTLSATQLIYSDKAWANYTIEKLMQTSRAKGRDAVRLDILQAAASAYLNLLRARSIERIQADNLKLTRKNLERARIRVEIGAAGPEEVYRWESQIAASRRNVLKAQSVTLDAVSAMNNILNRPLSEMFTPEEADFADPLGILPDRRLTKYMENAGALAVLRDFLVAEGLEASPELQQVKAGIDAQKRGITSAKREFWMPDVSLFGDVTESFSKSGEGSDYAEGRDETDWSVGVQVSLPLFSGGRKSAALTRSREELEQLHHERDSLANGIEEKILNAVHLVRASYPGIQLSNDAAGAARSNLTLVSDAYARGIKSIIDLIDAQNQSLVADQQAANAVYDFLIDMMTIQRSVGSFFLFAPQEEVDKWMARLNRHQAGSK